MKLDIYHYIVQTLRTHNTKSEPGINYGLWVVRMCRCRYVYGNKCPILEWDVDSRGGYAFVGTWGI